MERNVRKFLVKLFKYSKYIIYIKPLKPLKPLNINMVNYKNGKVYKLVCSTTQSLKERLKGHLINFKYGKTVT